MIHLFFVSYMLIDYLMAEKEKMEQTKKWLAEQRNLRERKNLKELADWHHQNFMQFLERPPKWIPWIVKQYLYGYRSKPSFREIQEEYAKRRTYFKEKEKIRIKIALACALLAALFVILKLR